MSSGRFPLFFLFTCFLVCSSYAQEKITAELGQDVILPCKVPNNYNIKNIVVEWIRPDQDPEYVLFYRDEHFDPENQHPFYQNRVDLQDKEMKDGDISLILKNVMKTDTGKYECRVFEEGKNELISIIYLEVSLSAQEKISAKIIPAELGQDVILPCKVPNNNNNITAVEWIRPDQDPEYVLSYRDGDLHPDNQHPSYQNRVDLQDKEMKDGDISLILKNVKMEDNGIYECCVFRRKNDPISIIYLEVRLSGNKYGFSRGRAGLIVSVVLFLLAVVSVCILNYRRRMRQNWHHPVLSVDPPATEMAIVPKSPAEPPTASETLMEPTAEEPTEM